MINSSDILGWTIESSGPGSWVWCEFGFGPFDGAEHAPELVDRALEGAVRVRTWTVGQTGAFVAFVLDQCDDYVLDPSCSEMLFCGIQRRLAALGGSKND